MVKLVQSEAGLLTKTCSYMIHKDHLFNVIESKHYACQQNEWIHYWQYKLILSHYFLESI